MGIYLGTSLSTAAPTSYVAFTPTGIEVVSPTMISLQAPIIQLNGQLQQTNAVGGGSNTVTLIGPVAVTNEVTAGTIPLTAHVHSGVQTGSANTGAPLP